MPGTAQELKLMPTFTCPKFAWGHTSIRQGSKGRKWKKTKTKTNSSLTWRTSSGVQRKWNHSASVHSLSIYPAYSSFCIPTSSGHVPWYTARSQETVGTEWLGNSSWDQASPSAVSRAWGQDLPTSDWKHPRGKVRIKWTVFLQSRCQGCNWDSCKRRALSGQFSVYTHSSICLWR